MPLSFDPGHLNLSLTHADRADEGRDWIGSLSYSRAMPRGGSLSASAFVTVEDSADLGGYIGYSMPLGAGASVTAGFDAGSNGNGAVLDVVRSETQEPGNLGWRLRAGRGEGGEQGAGVTYRTGFARLAAGAAHSSAGMRATAEIDGALAIAGGGVFVVNRIDDAFAVVDVGAPGVEVLHENRPAGKTGRNGRLILPNLRSYERNQIAIDPADLPVDAVVPSTKEVVVPADRSGVAVGFGVSTEIHSALVEFSDEAGAPIEAGSSGDLTDGGGSFFVGYDGQAYITGLGQRNVATITRTDGTTCSAEFGFEPEEGTQVQIPGVMCVAVSREE
jgi:outer membrane usher protein